MKDQFKFVNSIAVTLKAGKVLELAKSTQGSRFRVTPSTSWPARLRRPRGTSGRPLKTSRPFFIQTEQYRATMPTIAIVDSGIDKNRADFDMGTRVIAEKVFTTTAAQLTG